MSDVCLFTHGRASTRGSPIGLGLPLLHVSFLQAHAAEMAFAENGFPLPALRAARSCCPCTPTRRSPLLLDAIPTDARPARAHSSLASLRRSPSGRDSRDAGSRGPARPCHSWRAARCTRAPQGSRPPLHATLPHLPRQVWSRCPVVPASGAHHSPPPPTLPSNAATRSEIYFL